MKILLVGNGGREHALAWMLDQSPLVEKIWIAPGNGGTSLPSKAENVPISSSKKDFPELVRFSQQNGVDLVVPGPEQPLVEGITTEFTKGGIPVFGPSEKAAQMEGSKTFSKDFMARHGIPTAEFGNFTDYQEALSYVNSAQHKVVIKADGLAGGKGVLIPDTKEEAREALAQVMEKHEFGSAGDAVVIEEYLEGDELSILAFSDGYTIVDLPPAQDHKRANDGDTGLNTGGMGAYAPAPIATPDVISEIREKILEPTIRGMRHDGFTFTGVLFVGIMLTARGPRVLEYNVRFGDPETQTVLGLLKTDLAEIMKACVDRRLDAIEIKIAPGYGATVVMAAGGYPGSYAKGTVITFDKLPPGVEVFHAGTALNKEGQIVTSGGRVLAVSAWAPTLRGAVDLAYQGVGHVHFDKAHFRKDIAHRAFRAADKVANITYASAGVDVDAGNAFVENIKSKVKSTARPGSSAQIGGFGGIFDIKKCGFKDPLLISATDGVGTKLIIAQTLGKHDTVGIDLVAMNANDLIVQGCEPLFFLDYYASGHLDQKTASDFVSGVADGCILAGCALVGGETAEMPGLYSGKDYDVNGTCVGAVERDEVLPKLDEMKEGDVVLGLASDGVHSNGFSLVRKILESKGLKYDDVAPWDPSTTVGLSLLTPTRIYVKGILNAIRAGCKIKGLAHITGGGLVENTPRALPEHLSATIDVSKWPLPNVFKWLVKAGNVPPQDAAKTLNMGIGMVVIVDSASADEATEILSKSQTVYKIGGLKRGAQECDLLNIQDWH